MNIKTIGTLFVSFSLVFGVMVTQAYGDPDKTYVSIPTETSIPGCETTNMCFIPYDVSVDKGGEVIWTNDDTAAHTVTSGTPSDSIGDIFDSSLMSPGSTFSHMFEVSGTFDYFCIVHPWMEGIVTVAGQPENKHDDRYEDKHDDRYEDKHDDRYENKTQDRDPDKTYVSIPTETSIPGCETTNMCFIPYDVSVDKGGEVIWTNDDTAAHTVTSGTPSDSIGDIFDSSLMSPGSTFSHMFEVSGTFDYFCIVHPWMEGIVTVAGQPENKHDDRYEDKHDDRYENKTQDRDPDKTYVSIPTETSIPGCETTNMCFIPYDVSVDKGGEVIWTNDDTAAHTVTSGTPSDSIGDIFDSSLMSPGSTFSHMFEVSGTFDYFCIVHPWMEGIVTVAGQPENKHDDRYEDKHDDRYEDKHDDRYENKTQDRDPDKTYVSIPTETSIPGCETTNMCFIPYDVSVDKGGEVIWTNDDTAAHTVTSGTPSDSIGDIFDSSLMSPGSTFSHMFEVSGTFDYFCIVHPWMEGIVTVAGQPENKHDDRYEDKHDDRYEDKHDDRYENKTQDRDPDKTYVSIPTETSIPGCETTNMCFIPYDVSVDKGGEVIWTNDDTAAHTVTSGTPSDSIGDIFDSSLMSPGSTFSHMFEVSGTFDYFCIVHPWMEGIVTVAGQPENKHDDRYEDKHDDRYEDKHDDRYENKTQDRDPDKTYVSIPTETSIPGCETTNMCFIPYDVSVDKGGEVIWTNDDTAAHTVTSGTPSDSIGDIFDSSLMSPGSTFSHMFEVSGTFDYFCIVHPWMEGIVTVAGQPENKHDDRYEDKHDDRYEDKHDDRYEDKHDDRYENKTQDRDPDKTYVSIPTETSIPGCETTNMCFIPYDVSVDKGGEVIWTNDDTAAHTVTSGTPSDSIGNIFDSSLMSPGSTFSHMFEVSGTFDYFCIVHPWMEGIVTVAGQPENKHDDRYEDKHDDRYEDKHDDRYENKTQDRDPDKTYVSIPTETSIPGCETTNMCFIPYDVSVDKGGEVIWTNDDTAAHTVTSGTPSDSIGDIFDSSLMSPGSTFSHMFEVSGTFDYFCIVHPWMEGIVTVAGQPENKTQEDEDHDKAYASIFDYFCIILPYC